MLKTLSKYLDKAFIIVILSCLYLSTHADNQSCIKVSIDNQETTAHLNIPTNTEQCIDIANPNNQEITIFSNTIGSHLHIINSSSSTKSTAIAADSYQLVGNNEHITLNVIAKSTSGNTLKILVSNEKETENIIFQNHAVNFLLLGLILSSITVNLLYFILKKSTASLHLGLLTTFTIIYFGIESTLPQLNLSESSAALLIKSISFLSCIAGLALLHSLTKISHIAFKLLTYLIISLFLLGLSPIIPLEIYRSFFITVVIFVFISLIYASKKEPNLYWYLIGSSLPSTISLAMIFLNELLPTIASYNMVLASVFLQNIFISKTVFNTSNTQPITSKKQINLEIQPHAKTDYLDFSKNILIPQLAGIVQLIKHSAPQLPSKNAACSIANLQLVDMYLSLLQPEITPNKIKDICSQLIDIIYENNENNSAIQESTKTRLLLTKVDTEFMTIAHQLITEINQRYKHAISSTVIGADRLFISFQLSNNKAPISTNKQWLIIDDNDNLLSVMAAQCDSIDQSYMLASNPTQAINTYLSHALDITDILIDWNLGNETAYHTIKYIHNLIEQHQLPQPIIHIMSAQKIYSANFSEFPFVELLEKPVTIEQLLRIKTSS